MPERSLSEAAVIVATVDPDAYASGTQLTDAIDMSVHREVVFYVLAGAIPSSGTYNFKVTESDSSGGTYKQISGKGITALTNAGTDSDKQAIVRVRAEDLSTGYRYIKGSLRCTGAASANDAAVMALATQSRWSDAVTTTGYGDLSTVDEIVA